MADGQLKIGTKFLKIGSNYLRIGPAPIVAASEICDDFEADLGLWAFGDNGIAFHDWSTDQAVSGTHSLHVHPGPSDAADFVTFSRSDIITTGASFMHMWVYVDLADLNKLEADVLYDGDDFTFGGVLGSALGTVTPQTNESSPPFGTLSAGWNEIYFRFNETTGDWINLEINGVVTDLTGFTTSHGTGSGSHEYRFRVFGGPLNTEYDTYFDDICLSGELDRVREILIGDLTDLGSGSFTFDGVDTAHVIEDDLLIFWVHNTTDHPALTFPGLTLTEQINVILPVNSAETLWTAPVPAAFDGSATGTLDFGETQINGFSFFLYRFRGVDPVAPVVQSASASGTSSTATLTFSPFGDPANYGFAVTNVRGLANVSLVSANWKGVPRTDLANPPLAQWSDGEVNPAVWVGDQSNLWRLVGLELKKA